MSLNIGDNFSYLGKKFLDNRQSFDTLESMNACSDVPIGFITFCKENNKRYEYVESGWVEYKSSITDEEAEKLNAAYLHSQTEHIQNSDLEGFATEEFVINKIEEVDLSGYVSKEELNNKGYLTSIPEEYVTDTELNNKGYLTEHQDLSDYALKSEIPTDYLDDVEVNEAETNENQTALDFYSNGEVVKTVYFSGGGGGTDAPPYISTIISENNILGVGETFNLQLDFSSTVTGRGTAKVFINDVESVSVSIPQGESVIPIEEKYFTKGINRVTVYVIDRTGTMSNSLTFYVRYGSLEIASDFDAYTAYDYGAVIRYYFTPTSVDTSLTLTMYMSIDGEVKPGVICTSDTRGYYTFPSDLGVGAHYCQAYIKDSAGSTSNILTFNLIILDDTSLVVASDTIDPSLEEGSQLSLDYKVYMKNNTSFITKTYVDNALVSTGTCGLETAYYKSSSLSEGVHTIKIEVYDVTETVSDYIIWTVTVTPSTYTMLEPVTAGALFIATTKNMTNASDGKEVWVGKDQDGTDINAILNNFAFNSESGWVDDELLITGASSVEVPVAPLANNARYGFTLDLEFASKMIGVEDALVLNLWDDTKDCGIKITTEKVILRSAEGNQCDLYFTDDEMTSVIFVIDRNEATAKIYLNGVMCSAFHLSDYSVDGVPYLEDFTVNSNIMLGGSGHARIRNLRVYQIALTTNEILNNFMANERDKGKQRELVEFQKGDHLPTLTIYCDFSGLGKDDKKPCSITYVSTDEEKYGKSFTLSHKKSTCQYQGTSSMAYPIKNYRINLADENGNKLKYEFPFGQPEHRYTLKADFMSSGHWTNTGLTKWINNNLYDYDEDDEKTMNPKKWYDINNGGKLSDTRECIYGFPCRLILVNDGNTPLNEGQNEPTPGNTKDMGIFNFNHDKDATDTMGFDTDVFPNCASYEVTANSDTSAGAFMSIPKTLIDSIGMIKAGSWISDIIPVAEFEAETLTIESDGTLGNLCVCWDSSNTSAYFNPNYGPLSVTDRDVQLIAIYFDGSGSEPTYVKMNGIHFNLVLHSEPTITLDSIYAEVDPTEELEYIKQSFELRFPDEDDVSEDWGFMGIPGEDGTGLKALIDWVDGCTDEEFVADFEEHFHKDYTLRYFLLVITLGMVDNLGKNMMLDTWDNKIFMPRFYDCDTICSYDNSGQLKFDVDIEMAQGYWNTSSSRLWTRIRDLMHDDLVAKYNDMRQNGLSYESLMQCFYDEQIAKIPQKYYNMDYDIKYAPFADSYLGMANGDTYEHLKRWLKNRLIFVDTLYDYAPSYNNDMLTIRANTTEPMTIYIETYTPVYQHLSWYNGQMDKKKIDGKVAVEFTGTAMAATDQEVLIYGGTNVKKITGISSMNPNRMLIGSATRLIELDAHDCPLLSDINANKSNLAPHVYLNKVNLSGCPLLAGNLIINNSPLVREIDIRGTGIVGLNLPSNLRNLEILKLPSAIKTLNLNDAGQLHTLEFESGSEMETVSMTNCNALTNVVNFDLENVPNVTLNNSYNIANELYFSKTTNLSLINMSNLERVIYSPNAEYEVFDKTNVDNASDYKVSVFNSPKCNTFMVTAPYRESYMKDHGEVKPDEVFIANSIDISDTRFTDVKLLATTDTNMLKLPSTTKNIIVDSAYDLDTEHLTDGDYDTIHTDLYEPYNTDYEDEVKMIRSGKISADLDSSVDFVDYYTVEYFEVEPNTKVYLTNNDVYNAGNAQIRIYEYDEDKTEIKYTAKWGHLTDEANAWVLGETTRYIRVYMVTTGTFTLNYTGIQMYIPNIVPSASDGSLIFAMYAPSMTDEPDSGVWDMSGLDIESIHTFGLNNDIVQDSEGNITMPNRYDDYAYELDNLRLQNEVLRYTASAANVFPTFSAETEFQYDSIVTLKDGLYEHIIVAKDPNNLPTQIAFSNGAVRDYFITVDYIDTSSCNNMESMFYFCSKLVSVNLTGCDTSKVTNMNYMFQGCTSLERIIGLNTLDTSNVTSMSCMFLNCKPLTSLDVSGFNTSKVTNMNSMFGSCSNLTSLDVSNFDTSNVTNISSMFSGCNTLISLDVSNFDTSNVTNMYGMFLDCKTLTSLDVSNFNTSKVTTMYGMFKNCSALTSLDVSNFDTSKVTSMYGTFEGCKSLTSLDVSSFDTSNVTNMNYIFENCSALTSLDVSGFNTSKVTVMAHMFNKCSALTSLDVSNFDTSNVANMSYMFYNCNAITSLDVSNFDTSKVTSAFAMFDGCRALMYLNVIGWPLTNYNQTAISTLPVGDDAKNEIYATVSFTVPSGWTLINPLEILIYTTSASGVLPAFNTEFTGYSVNETDNGDGTYGVKITTDELSNLPTSISFAGKTDLLTVEKINTSNVTNMATMFQNCSALTSLDVSNFDTSKVTNMMAMFFFCGALTSLDVSGFNTSNVTTMINMFNGCGNLTSLDVSNFDTSKVTSMARMFNGCVNLTSLDVSGFDTSNVTSMENMFYNCYALTSLDVSNFNTTNVTNMGYMFSGCSALTSLDLSNFNTSNVTNMNYMFSNCSQLTSLDVSNFDTSKVTNMSNMFRSCKKLTSLDLSNFNMEYVQTTGSMFYYCEELSIIEGMDSWYCPKLYDISCMFQGANAFTRIDASSWKRGEEGEATITAVYSFANNTAVTYLDISNLVFSDNINFANTTQWQIQTLKWTNWTEPIDISIISSLTQDCIIDLIANLAVVTDNPTLTIGSTFMSYLTEEQIAAATAKGWTIA